MSVNTVKPLQEAEELSPTAIIAVYIIDASEQGGVPLRIAPQTMPDGSDIVWQGVTYTRYPINVKGFEFSSKGELPRPHVTVSNLFGTFTALNINHEDLARALFIRKRFFYKHLIAVPQPVNGGYPDDVYYFSRKISQNKVTVEYELSSGLEIDGLMLPNEQVFANLCRWKYRSPECSYTGPPVGSRAGIPPPYTPTTFRGTWVRTATYARGEYVRKKLETNYLGITRYRQYLCLENGTSGAVKEPPNKLYWFEDECSKRVTDGCKFRFGVNAVLPFGGYPGTGRLPDISQG